MKKSVIGILAHVDAGKTTLAEALLYKCGKIRSLGRVDNGDTLLDSHELERQRGITIFASQAVFDMYDWKISLLDTPGHVDFSAETERILQILDYAILVISGTDGVQSHTLTLWNLLKSYGIPVIIFVTKMDLTDRSRKDIIEELKKELDGGCISFSDDVCLRDEELAMCREDAMEEYLSKGKVSRDIIRELTGARLAFPCFFGSGLKMTGVDELIKGLNDILLKKTYPKEFGARVFKITRSQKDGRIVHLKITGGTLKVRDTVNTGEKDEKVAALRIYSGEKFDSVNEASAGDVCAVTGLSDVQSGQGLGIEKDNLQAFLEPVMRYRIILPEGEDPKVVMPKLKLLEEEDPMLKISWNSRLEEIGVSLMGEVQAEILKSLIFRRFGISVRIDQGRVLYKETIGNTVEGVGHYEPLRHYAEVHLILSPLERGKGLLFETKCSEDLLGGSWQRLILTHLQEKQHLGVLIGAPVTDMKITLAAGRAHIKHTEGGDFRQAAYRAVRQGLMQAESILLEPYYSFYLDVPSEHIGRAISDIKAKSGELDPPVQSEGRAVLTGKAPVASMNGYASEVAAYTSGRGKLRLTVCGYDVCHNSDKVIEESDYRPESDLENSPDSVFCAHGSGFPVKWNDVPEYMHIESCLKKKKNEEITLNRRNFHIDDKELRAIMEREFGPERETQILYRSVPKTEEKPAKNDPENEPRQKYLIVDGYNCIFAWDELKQIAEDNLEAARHRLADILCNYGAFVKTEIILVFDGYKVKGNQGETINYHNIHIAFTKERELGDVYIEKLISQIGKNYNVRVVTSDGLIQLTAVNHGVLRVSAAEFEEEVNDVRKQIRELAEELNLLQ
ncbi:MAG: TetM/TetW/TetO/TetS family tetracycline resistance ribosomal protection protein [Clostridiales bacterium]|nr:TetM/TetW/TetO/TetS family tetracycline resistance ribosomal protection protein [Clostridiales bacterium]